MKVCFDRIGGIIIRPETDFEESWLKDQFKEESNVSTVSRLKTGVSGADFVGVLIHRVAGFAQP